MAGEDRLRRHGTASRAELLTTALRLIDRDGAAALTMRRLADELGVTAMALYNHVANKEALLDGIVGLLATEFRLLDADEPWPQRLRTCFREIRRVCLAHPNVVEIIGARRQATTTLLQPMECALAALADAGLTIEESVHAWCALIGLTMGHVGYQLEGHRQNQASVPLPDGFPRVAAARTARFDFDAAFEYALDIFVEGLERSRSGGVT
jgi:AcrR family transcriptional regulator